MRAAEWAKEMTVTGVVLVAEALFWVIEHETRPLSFQVLGKSCCSVQTRCRTVAKPYQFLCKCPFRTYWKSPDTSQKADAMSAKISKVLSAIKRTPVSCICRPSLFFSLSKFLTKKICDNQKKKGKREKSLSLSLQVCAVSWFAWKGPLALAWQPVFIVILGHLSAAKFSAKSLGEKRS